MGPLLVMFAHPDDETFTSAGLMAAAVERGVAVTVISATRGEAGESALPGLDDPDDLGEVRERELRDAMRQIGVSDVRFLGYRDSGLEGSPFAGHPRAFVRVPAEVVASELAAHIRAIRPHTAITFGPDGIYGHPDHLHMHHCARLAVETAADPAGRGCNASAPWRIGALYFGTFPREEMLALFDRAESPLDFLSEETRANLGTPRAQITHALEIGSWAEAKRAAISAHRTQTAEGGPLSDISPEAAAWQLSQEFFVRAPLLWPTSADEDRQDIVAHLVQEQAMG